MTITKRITVFFATFFTLTALAVMTPAHSFAAPKLYLDPGSTTVNKGSEFTVNLQIDAENQSAYGADAFINFPADLTLVSVNSGGFFPGFDWSQSSGHLELHGYFPAVFDSKTGSGTFVTFKFSTQKDSGSATISFTCTGSGNDTQIINTDGDNILNCGNVNQSNITFVAENNNNNNDNTSGDDTTTKSCGGSCSTNANCNSDLFCSQGSCRNPACSSSTNCICTTASPKPAAAVKPASPTPQSVTLTPLKTPAEAPSAAPENTEDTTKVSVTPGSLLLPLAIIVILVALLLAYIKSRKKKKEDDSAEPNIPVQDIQ